MVFTLHGDLVLLAFDAQRDPLEIRCSQPDTTQDRAQRTLWNGERAAGSFAQTTDEFGWRLPPNPDPLGQSSCRTPTATSSILHAEIPIAQRTNGQIAATFEMAELTPGRKTASRPEDPKKMKKFLWILGSWRDEKKQTLWETTDDTDNTDNTDKIILPIREIRGRKMSAAL